MNVRRSRATDSLPFALVCGRFFGKFGAWSRSTACFSRSSGMNPSAARARGPRPEPLAIDAWFGDEARHVRLADGREVAVLLEWFPRLRDATPEPRQHW